MLGNVAADVLGNVGTLTELLSIRGWGRLAPCLSLCLVLGCGADESELIIKTVSEYDSSLSCPGVSVQVNDRAWSSSNDDGETSFHGVELPYTVRVFQSETGPSGYRYYDIWEVTGQESNPLVLEVDATFCREPRRAKVTGTVSGRAASEAETSLSSLDFVSADGHSFETYISWQGPLLHRTVLRTIEVERYGDNHYLSYGETPLELEASVDGDGILADVSIELAPVTEQQVSGWANLPAAEDTRVLLSKLLLRFSDGYSLTLDNGTLSDPSFDYTFPDIVGAQTFVGLYYGGGAGSDPQSVIIKKVTLPSAGVELDLAAPVELIAPQEDASISTDAVFSWNAAGVPGRYALHMTCQWYVGELRHHVDYRAIDTDQLQASLPDTPDLDIPAGTSCLWSVYSFPGADAGHDPSRWDEYTISQARRVTIQ